MALEPWSPALYGDRAMAMVCSWISSGVGKASVWTWSHWRIWRMVELGYLADIISINAYSMSYNCTYDDTS